jgi:lipoyl(octanoyl) transferase
MKLFHLLHLGRIDYAESLQLQEKLITLRKENRIGDTLVLLEHPPVITIGRNSHRENILATDGQLQQRGVTLHEINRGGDVTYHGPGQLVGYPILDLRGELAGPEGKKRSPHLGAVDYVRELEQVLIRTCAEYGILTQRIPGRTGVWTIPIGSAQERKIAAIGVHISRAITSHGFALNVTTDLRDFDLIVPCGIHDRAVTSIEEELATERAVPSLNEVANATARSFAAIFGGQMLAASSVEDLLLARS